MLLRRFTRKVNMSYPTLLMPCWDYITPQRSGSQTPFTIMPGMRNIATIISSDRFQQHREELIIKLIVLSLPSPFLDYYKFTDVLVPTFRFVLLQLLLQKLKTSSFNIISSITRFESVTYYYYSFISPKHL